MRGEFIGVWSETWREIWQPLVNESLGEAEESIPDDIFCELYRALAGDPKRPGALKSTPSVQVLADIVDSPLQSRETFTKTKSEDIIGEAALVTFLESAYDALDDLGGDQLTNRYFNLLSAFVEKFSLRYDLRRPCMLCPTLPGVFASLVRDLRVFTSQDPHLDGLMKDFENAIRDLRQDCTDGRIKTCIQKQINLLEAIGRTCSGITETELGGICNQLDTWPHKAVKAALKNLYGFASDYPGIRHAGTPKNVLRAIEMRDMIAMSILLAGFTPYLSNVLDLDAVYRGA